MGRGTGEGRGWGRPTGGVGFMCGDTPMYPHDEGVGAGAGAGPRAGAGGQGGRAPATAIAAPVQRRRRRQQRGEVNPVLKTHPHALEPTRTRVHTAVNQPKQQNDKPTKRQINQATRARRSGAAVERAPARAKAHRPLRTGTTAWQATPKQLRSRHPAAVRRPYPFVDARSCSPFAEASGRRCAKRRRLSMNGAARSYDLGVELAEDFVVLAGLAVQPILERQQQQRLVDVDARRRRADRDRATAQRNRTVGARSRSRLLAGLFICFFASLFLLVAGLRVGLLSWGGGAAHTRDPRLTVSSFLCSSTLRQLPSVPAEPKTPLNRETRRSARENGERAQTRTRPMTDVQCCVLHARGLGARNKVHAAGHYGRH